MVILFSCHPQGFVMNMEGGDTAAIGELYPKLHHIGVNTHTHTRGVGMHWGMNPFLLDHKIGHMVHP